MPEPRPLANITHKQGAAIASDIIQDIDSEPELRGSEFGIDVRKKAVGVRAWLNDNNVFTMKTQKALKGWSTGVSRWLHHRGTVQ